MNRKRFERYLVLILLPYIPVILSHVNSKPMGHGKLVLHFRGRNLMRFNDTVEKTEFKDIN